MKKSIYLAALLAAVLPGSLSAATLVQYTFDINNDTTAFDATTKGTGITATAVSQTGFTSVSTNNSPAFTPGRSRAVTFQNIDDLFTTDHYYEFTVTASAGNALDLTNLTFYYNLSSGTAGATANSRYQLRYDNLADGAGFVTVGTTDYTTNTTGLLANFDLSGASFDNLTQGITFRLDVADSGSAATNSSVRLDQLSVDGAVVAAVPEPSAMATLLGGLGIMIGFQRSRRRIEG